MDDDLQGAEPLFRHDADAFEEGEKNVAGLQPDLWYFFGSLDVDSRDLAGGVVGEVECDGEPG